MKRQFEERFALELQKIEQAIVRKGGIKNTAKVHERIGRARQRYSSVQYYYDIAVIENKQTNTAISIQWSKK